jgi:hypothetical protein
MPDFRAGGLVLETKQGASNLDILVSSKKVDYVCYCPDFRLGDRVELVSYVMSKENFLTVLTEAGLIRQKKATDGTWHTSIQSYKNSKKKYELFLDLLDEYNEMSLEEYRAMAKSSAKRG